MDRQLDESNIYLIGMMGAGKTTVGKLLAKKLDYRFIDTDDRVKRFAKKTIREIFDTEGEAKFRDLETKRLEKISTRHKRVVATGGGIVQTPKNWDYLKTGSTIWLNADLNLLKERLANDSSRPLASQVESLFPARLPLYRQADLHITIESKQIPEEIVTEIMNLRTRRAS